jgi:hypothetical protein
MASALVGAIAVVATFLPAPPLAANPTANPTADLSTVGAPYWHGWDIARGVALRHNGRSGGYVADAFGGLHAFGGAPPVVGRPYTPGRESVANIALRPGDLVGALLRTDWSLTPFGKRGQGYPVACTPFRGAPPRGASYDPVPRQGAIAYAGATVDAFGNVAPFCDSAPLVTTGGPHWPGWPIARGLAITEGLTGGIVLDGFGGLHAFGRARIVTPGPYWHGWDIARGVAVDGQGSGVIVDGFGGLHPFSYTVA